MSRFYLIGILLAALAIMGVVGLLWLASGAGTAVPAPADEAPLGNYLVETDEPEPVSAPGY